MAIISFMIQAPAYYLQYGKNYDCKELQNRSKVIIRYFYRKNNKDYTSDASSVSFCNFVGCEEVTIMTQQVLRLIFT
jgi:hypothetical protein